MIQESDDPFINVKYKFNLAQNQNYMNCVLNYEFYKQILDYMEKNSTKLERFIQREALKFKEVIEKEKRDKLQQEQEFSFKPLPMKE